MTLQEQLEIIQAAVCGEEILQIEGLNGVWGEIIYGKDYRFNFYEHNYRIKPKESEQPDIVKTEIVWDNNNKGTYMTNSPNTEGMYEFKLCEVWGEYRLVGFKYDKQIEGKDVHDSPIKPRFDHEIQEWEFLKAESVIWEKIK